MSTNFNYKMGWIRDCPDFRDYTEEDENVKEMAKQLGLISSKLKNAKLPAEVDLRKYCSSIEDQENLGSCTANAGVGLVEYMERKASGKHIEASRLFLYKAIRNLLRLKGDTGASIRSTMGALVIFGVPPEEYWDYKVEDFDKEPPAFCYSFAQNYQTIKYLRLDAGVSGEVLLNKIKTYLSKNIPSIFGFTVYDSIEKVGKDGKIPFPSKGERVLGGHAIMAIGYDDKMEITNPESNQKTIGAFIIRNSWGESWGDKGYGYLPYQYVLDGLAVDWWTILKQEWIDTGEFGE